MQTKLNWRDLNEVLPQLTEPQVHDMLESEKAGPKRMTTLVRLHQRLTSLRAQRERDELMQLAVRNTQPE